VSDADLRVGPARDEMAAGDVRRGVRRRPRCAAVCGLVLGLVVWACNQSDEAPRPPRLTFSETAYDFGRVAQGAPVEHRFAFTNDGGSELSVVNLRAACDCTATLLGGRDFPPHAGGAVQARFDTDAVYGPQRRTVTVYSNDPTQRSVMLTVTGEVELDVAAESPRVYLGTVPPGATLVREVALRTSSDAVRVGRPQSDAPQLTLQLTDAVDGDAAATLAIGTAPSAPPGPFSAVVRVPTTSVRHPMLRVTVTGIIAPDAPMPTPRGALGGQPNGGDRASGPPDQEGR
jgi:hypothetical protein